MRSLRASRARRGGRSCASTGSGAGCGWRRAHSPLPRWASGAVTWALAYGAVLAHNGDTARTPRKSEDGQDGLAHRVLHNPLTDLPNRTLFFDRLELALARLRRQRTAVAVLFIDLD